MSKLAIVLAVALLAACTPDLDNGTATGQVKADVTYRVFSPAEGITCVVWFANYFRKSDALSCIRSPE